MKKMKCKDLGGACDTYITGNTPEEIGDNCTEHVRALKMAGDTSHDEAIEKMTNMSPADFQVFWAGFLKRFEEAEEA